jgi:phospholipid/cholesterol/gamma-HCH transport system ATP-binding protein
VLLKCIVGLHDVDSGSVYYDDIVFNRLNFKKKKEIRKNIGMVFQGGALFDSSTVEENVRYPLDMFTEMSDREKLHRVNECLEVVNIQNANHLYPAEISGGMQKRVAIARAIALNPKYLFFDEPISGLDPKTAIRIDRLIQSITKDFHTTTIINTHDMNSVMEIGEKVIFIYKGQKWWEGDRNEILDSDNNELNDFVFATNLAKTVRDLRREGKH